MKTALAGLLCLALLFAGCTAGSSEPSGGAPDVRASGDGEISSDTTAPDAPPDVRTFSTLQDVLGWERSARCTWMFDTGTTGEMWIKEGKWHQEWDMRDGKHVKSINDGTYMYMWGEQMRPVKFPLDLRETIEGLAGTPVPPPPDASAGYEYECVPADMPDSMFFPPAGVEFTDVGETVLS